MAAKFAPIMSKFVETRGRSSTAALFDKALARVVAFARRADNCQPPVQAEAGQARLLTGIDAKEFAAEPYFTP